MTAKLSAEAWTPERHSALRRMCEAAGQGPVIGLDALVLTDALAEIERLSAQVREAEAQRHALFLESGRLLAAQQKRAEEAESRWEQLKAWHEEWVALLSRPEARSADNVVQKQSHLTALEKMARLEQERTA